MPSVTRYWPRDKAALCDLGVKRVALFCRANRMEVPPVTIVPLEDWYVGACAYYRPGEWIRICLEECGTPCSDDGSPRNWSWPGSTTDREPYGVVAHELAHHCDFLTGDHKWAYGSEYSESVMSESRESPVTSYCPNPAEWFAEIFRVFVTNPALLRAIRPRAYGILLRRWRPVGSGDWKDSLGANVPRKVLRTLTNKIGGIR